MSETTTTKSSVGGGGPRPATSVVPALPEWAAERLIASVGKGPAAVRSWLDFLATSKIFPVNMAVGMLSSVWLGILWLFLTSVYIAIGSGFVSLRAAMEITELQFFDGWPMIVLMVLLTLNLAVVTLRRIPLTLYKLGVWTVHFGIITLVAGCFLYFSQKREGQTCVYLNKTADCVFDTNARAIYLRRVDGAGREAGKPVMVPLPTLPIYHEHLSRNAFLAAGGAGDAVVDDPENIAIDSETLAGQDAKLRGLTVRVVGYYPYVDFNGPWMAGPDSSGSGDAPNPAVRVSLRVAEHGGAGGSAVVASKWLIGKRPAERVADEEDAPFGLEYLYHPTDEQVRDATVSFHGPLAITVRVPKLNIERTYAVERDKPMVIEGTPYTLTPGEVSGMPMLSKGYEGGWSSTLMVDVVRKDPGVAGHEAGEFKFQRQALFRYPERSPDFVTVDGKPKRIQGRVDNDIEIIFHDASRHQFRVLEDGSGNMTLAHRDTTGKCEIAPMRVGQSSQVKMGEITLGVGLDERTGHATQTPRIVPVESRQSSMNAAEAITNSAVELELTDGPWSRQHIYVPFVEFARWDAADGVAPAQVEVPGIGRLQVVLSTVRRDLPVEVTLSDFRAVKRPGAVRAFNDFVSTVDMKDKRTGQVQRRVISLNNPTIAQGLTFFQAKFDGHDDPAPADRFSVLGVGNRPGINVMTTGAALMIAGVLYAFYVKPLLLRKKKAMLQAYLQQSSGSTF